MLGCFSRLEYNVLMLGVDVMCLHQVIRRVLLKQIKHSVPILYSTFLFTLE